MNWFSRVLLRQNAGAFSFQSKIQHQHRHGKPLAARVSSFQTELCRPMNTRLYVTNEKTLHEVIRPYEQDHLLDPFDILRDLSSNQNDNNQEISKIPIPLPTHLSPTSLETFRKCPQAFFFLYILKLTPDPPMTPQLARGIICHKALEEVFDLSPENRSLVNLENLFRREWNKLRGDRREDALGGNSDLNEKDEGYQFLFRECDGSLNSFHDIEAEIDWGKSSLELLRKYYNELEDPKNVDSPNPLMREMWVQAQFPLDNYNDTNEYVVRGKIDRIDVLQGHSGKLLLNIIDYKTGKKPHFKYSESANERIAQEQVWKMKVYALILWKMILHTDKTSEQSTGFGHEGQSYQKGHFKYSMPWVLQQKLMQVMAGAKQNQRWSDILELKLLRLMYLTSHLDDPSSKGKAAYLDSSLGCSSSEFHSIIDRTELEVQTIAKDIKILVDKQSPHAFQHCNWKYCSCHGIRRKFRPGSVFQSHDSDL